MTYCVKGTRPTLDVGSGSMRYAPTTSRGDVNLDIGPPNGRQENFVLGDAHHLPFRANTFRLTYFYDVIEHVESPIRALREIRRVSSAVEISTPNPLHWRKFLRAARGKDIILGSQPDHISTWTDAEIRNLLALSGFKNVVIRFVVLPASRLVPARHIRWDVTVHGVLGRLFGRVTGRHLLVMAK